MKLWLRAGERIFINGAVLRVDRKVALEFMNDVTFLLESHVMQAEQATTPLRQLYFIVQTMAIDPASLTMSKELFEKSHWLLMAAFSSAEVLEGLQSVEVLVASERYYEALKTLRSLFPVEDAILGRARLGHYIDNTDKREVA
jgi:flagellar biosynthesis repressor protein FlbT